MPNIYDVASAIKQPDISGNIQKGMQSAQVSMQNQNILAKQQQGLQDTQDLRALAPQVISGDPNAYAQAAAIDPAQAGKYQSAGDDQLKRLQGAMALIDQQQTPQAKEAIYQQVRPYLARFGQDPPATFAEAEPKMEAARAQIAMLGQQQKQGLINVGAGGAVLDPTTGKVVYQNPGVDKLPSGVAELQYLQQHPDLAAFQRQQKADMRAPEAPQRETFGQPQQVIGPDGKPQLVQFGTLGAVRPVAGGYVKPEMTPAQAAKAAVQQQKAEESKSDAVASYDQSINQIDTLLSSPGASMLGTFSGDIAGMIPHSDTANANAALDNIKNQVLLNTIAKLKALSATGASGFGSLSNQEGEILKNSIASLDKKQSNQQLLYNLRQIKGLLQQSRDRIAGKAVEFGDASQGGAGSKPSDENDISDLLEKYK